MQTAEKDSLRDQKTSTERYVYILVDVANILWKFYRTYKEETYNRVLEYVKGIAREYLFSDARYYFLFDNPTSAIEYRRSVDASYKHDREWQEGFNDVMEAFHILVRTSSSNYYTCFLKGYEADDLVIPVLDSLILNSNNRALLLSTDLDWARALTWDVDWHDTKRIHNMRSFRELHGFYPGRENIMLYKAFRGDHSDSIPVGMPGFMDEDFIQMIENRKIESLSEALIYAKENKGPWQKRFNEHEKRVRINYELVKVVDIHVPVTEVVSQCCLNENIRDIISERRGLW